MQVGKDKNLLKCLYKQMEICYNTGRSTGMTRKNGGVVPVTTVI